MISLLRKFPVFAAAWLCLIPLHSTRAASSAGARATNSLLAIDGVACGPVQQWQGGEAIGEIVVEGSLAGAPPKKHLGGVRYSPITVTLAYPPAAPVVALISDFFANKSSTKTVTLTDLTFDSKVAGSPLEAVNARLTEVNFEAFDAASKDPVHLTLVFSTELVRAGTATTGPASTVGGKAKQVNGSGYEFRLGTLTKTISAISAFTAKRPAGGAGLLPLEFSNLIVTLPLAQSADWQAWADDFIIKGNNGDSQEKSGTLEILDQTRDSVLTLQFSHVGIVRFSHVPVPSGAEGIRRVQAELYCEQVSLTPPSAGASSNPKPPEKAAPAESSSKTKTGGSEKNPATPVIEVPAATDTKTASADQGARDPADFPRPKGLARKTFSSLRRPGSSEETATYSTKLSFDELVSTYERTLKTDGWEQTMRNESGDPAAATHQFRLRWTKALLSVEIRLTQAKSGGSEVSVAVTNTRAGALAPTADPASKKTVVTEAAAASPQDQGARDPADFPRPAGSVRKTYSALGTAATPQETVVYTAKISIAQAEAFYVKSLGGGEWEETFRRETGDPAGGTHQVVMNWSKGRRSVVVTLTENSPDVTGIEATLVTAAR